MVTVVKNLIVLACLYPALAWGTVAPDASSTSTGSGTSTISWSHTVTGADKLLICSAHISAGGNVSTFKFNSIDLSWKASRHNGASYTNYRVELWFLIAPETGTHTVDLTLASNADRLVGGCTSFSDAHQTTPLGTALTNTNDGDVNTSPPSITVPAGGLGYDVVAFGNSVGACATPTPGGSQTQRFDDCVGASGDNATGSSSTISATGAMSWANLPSAFGAQVAVPINQAVAVTTPRASSPFGFQ